MENNKITIKVAGSSSVPSVSGSIVKAIEDHNEVEIKAIGAGAVNQAVKAIACSQGIVATKGYDLNTKFGFDKVNIDGQDRTAILFRLQYK